MFELKRARPRYSAPLLVSLGLLTACGDSQRSFGSSNAAPDPTHTPGADDAAISEFVLDPAGPLPVTLRTLTRNATTHGEGVTLVGEVQVAVPGNAFVTLSEAKLELAPDSARGEGLQSLSGTVRLPFPNSGFMSGVQLSNPVYASAR